MQAEYQILSAFQQLLNAQPDLFADSDRTELEELMTASPNETDRLAEAIGRWCTSRSNINNALMALISDPSTNNRGIGGTFPDAQTREEYEKNLRDTLLNSLRQSSPPESPKPPKTDE